MEVLNDNLIKLNFKLNFLEWKYIKRILYDQFLIIKSNLKSLLNLWGKPLNSEFNVKSNMKYLL